MMYLCTNHWSETSQEATCYLYIYIHTYIYIYISCDWHQKKRQQHNLQKQDVPHLHKSFRWSSCNWELALARSHWFTWKKHGSWWQNSENDLGMDQYQLIPFLGEWTSIYQLFWCSPGVQGFDTLPFPWKRLQSRCHGLSKALACTLGRLSWPSFCLKYFTGLYWTLASTDSHGTSKRNKYKYNLKLTRALVITTREKKENNALTRAWVYHHWRCGFGIRNEQNTCSILQCFFLPIIIVITTIRYMQNIFATYQHLPSKLSYFLRPCFVFFQPLFFVLKSWPLAQLLHMSIYYADVGNGSAIILASSATITPPHPPC